MSQQSGGWKRTHKHSKSEVVMRQFVEKSVVAYDTRLKNVEKEQAEAEEEEVESAGHIGNEVKVGIGPASTTA